MQYLMFTYFDQGVADRYEASSQEEQEAEIAAHVAWFEEHGNAITGGHELAWPRRTAGIRSGERPVITDGPFLETKEILGGVIVIEAESLEAAVSIAEGWPSLAHPGAYVEVVARHVR